VSGSSGLRILGQPDPATPRDVRLVGRYALGVDWADGHGSIYPFDRLRGDCPCGGCDALGARGAAATQPSVIARTDAGLAVTWTDAHEGFYRYADLRALCRCAACTGGH